MKQYPDPQEHYKVSMASKIEAAREDMQKRGIIPNKAISHAIVDRLYAEAKEDYEEQRASVLLHNLKVIEEAGQAVREQEKQRVRRMMPVIAVLFAFMVVVICCSNFMIASDRVAEIIDCCAALPLFAFILIDVLKQKRKEGRA